MISHGGINPRESKGPAPKKELENLQIKESENGGHSVTSHFSSFDHPPEMHVFAKPAGKIALPAGHVLEHIAKKMHIPHTLQDGQQPPKLAEPSKEVGKAGIEEDEEED